MTSATKGTKTYTFTYNDEGLRTSKTVDGVTTYYYYEGTLLVAEQSELETIVYLYDSTGAPIGFRYRTPSYAENVWDDYYYEKNMQGDIVRVYNSEGVKLVSYVYTAWGDRASTTYHNGGANTTVTNNPFTYRGYYYDRDLDLYYLQSRYYDSKICRFISPDHSSVVLATPMALTDKNLYAYCDNNPVTRADHDGEFWNYVIGAVVGAVVNGAIAAAVSYFEDGEIDWVSVRINAAVGAASGVVAASGLGAISQAGITAALNGIGSFADQAQSDGVKNVNYEEIAICTALGGVTSLAGTAVGKISGGKWLNQSKELTDKGQSKLLAGVIRRTVGQSHSALMRQGYKYLAMAVKPTNIFRGVSSVMGTVISGGVSGVYSAIKKLWGW